MSKPNKNPITREAAKRIISTETKTNGGQQPAGGAGTRIDRNLQRKEAAPTSKKQP
jgi:hypothetical protein